MPVEQSFFLGTLPVLVVSCFNANHSQAFCVVTKVNAVYLERYGDQVVTGRNPEVCPGA